MRSKAGDSFAKLSIVTFSRTSSSLESTVSWPPFLIGTTDLLNQPLAQAVFARCCDAAPSASTSVLQYPCKVAIRSAESPCGICTTASLNDTSELIGPPEPKIETNESISTPPATMTSAWPAISFAAAVLTASKPDPQN